MSKGEGERKKKKGHESMSEIRSSNEILLGLLGVGLAWHKLLPCFEVSTCSSREKGGHPHTAVNVLLDKVLDGALVGLGHGLLLDGAAAIVEALGLVHGALQGVTLPAVIPDYRLAIKLQDERGRRGYIPKHVVGVSAGAIALKRPHERVLVLGRVPEVVELGRIPLNLEGDLRHADRVARGARRRVGEALASDRVVHVALVVWGIEVLAVPASDSHVVSNPPWMALLTSTGSHLRSKVVGREDAAAALPRGPVGNDSATAAS